MDNNTLMELTPTEIECTFVVTCVETVTRRLGYHQTRKLVSTSMAISISPTNL